MTSVTPSGPTRPWTGPVVVTGTDTGVGKTVVTAAIAAAATGTGLFVSVVKPAQTGTTDGGEPDTAVVERLAGHVGTRTLAQYPDPLAPRAAARISGRPELRLDEVVTGIRAVPGDLVLIEGAGGLLVPMGADGWTMGDLAAALGAPVVVTARAGLGTLNHTALTLTVLAARGLTAQIVIGAWPAWPELVHRTNLHDLPGTIAGVVPDGAGTWPPAQFRTQAPGWLSPTLHGRLDPRTLRSRGR